MIYLYLLVIAIIIFLFEIATKSIILIDSRKIKNDYLFEVWHKDGIFLSFLFNTKNIVKYRGHGTVWHEYPSGDRCGTDLEYALSEWWQAAEWGDEKE